MTITAITGGIGAGKSVISRILTSMAYPVYDSDSEAKALMDADADICRRLAAEIAADVLAADGSIDRRRLAEIVFSDAAKLATLNAIVHAAVRRHFSEWCYRQNAQFVFIETAILFESRLNRMVDAEWRVTAPESIRVARVMARNNVSAEEVRRRIEAQRFNPDPNEPVPALTTIVNDGEQPVLPQILEALAAAGAL